MSERHSMEPNERIKTAATGAMSAAKSQTVGGAEEHPSPTVVDAHTIEAITAGWPKMSKSAANEIIQKYGRPNEAIPSRLIWYTNGPWKRTVVYRHEIPHNFPQPHTDVVEQFIAVHRLPRAAGEVQRASEVRRQPHRGANCSRGLRALRHGSGQLPDHKHDARDRHREADGRRSA
jgi:hypothetical protein